MTIYPKFIQQELKKLLPATLGLCLIYFLINMLVALFPMELNHINELFHNRLAHYFMLGIMGCTGASFMAGDNKNGMTRLHLQLPWKKEVFYLNKGIAQCMTICIGGLILRGIIIGLSLQKALGALSLLDILFSYHLLVFSVIFSLKSRREIVALIKSAAVSVSFLYFGIFMMYLKDTGTIILYLIHTVLCVAIIGRHAWLLGFKKVQGKMKNESRGILGVTAFIYLGSMLISFFIVDKATLSSGLLILLYHVIPVFFIDRFLGSMNLTNLNTKKHDSSESLGFHSRFLFFSTGKWIPLCALVTFEMFVLIGFKLLSTQISMVVPFFVIAVNNALFLPIVFILPGIEKDGIRYFMNYLPIPRSRIWSSRYLLYLILFVCVTVIQFCMAAPVRMTDFMYPYMAAWGVSLLFVFNLSLIISLFFESHIVAVFVSAVAALSIIGITWLKIITNSIIHEIYFYYMAGYAILFLCLFHWLFSKHHFMGKSYGGRRKSFYLGCFCVAIFLFGLTCIRYQDLYYILFG